MTLNKKSYKNIMLDKLPKSPQITQPSPRINLKTETVLETMKNSPKEQLKHALETMR